MVTSEVEPEAVVRNSVAVVAASLTPSAVLRAPRTGARLNETAAHLPLVLWDAARVDAAMRGLGSLDAAMIDAAEGLLRSRGLRRLIRRLLMLLCLLRFALLLMLLRGLLLMLLSLLRFALLFFVLLALCVRRSNGSEEQKQGACADSQFHEHVCLPLKI